MKYALNDKTITKEQVKVLVEDLALFPYNKEDYGKSRDERLEMYFSELEKNKSLKISDTLTITTN